MHKCEPVMISLASINRHDVFTMDGKTFRAMCDAKKIANGNVHLYAMQIPTIRRGDWERSIEAEPSRQVEVVERLIKLMPPI